MGNDSKANETKLSLGCLFGEHIIVCRGFAVGRPSIVSKQMAKNKGLEKRLAEGKRPLKGKERE